MSPGINPFGAEGRRDRKYRFYIKPRKLFYSNLHWSGAWIADDKKVILQSRDIPQLRTFTKVGL